MNCRRRLQSYRKRFIYIHKNGRTQNTTYKRTLPIIKILRGRKTEKYRPEVKRYKN